jgi:hypothetical protein
MDSNHELALLLVLAAIGMAAAAVLVVTLIVLTIGLIASFLGALMTGAARALTVPRPYALSTPARSSSSAVVTGRAGSSPQREREWLDSWFEDPAAAQPTKWSLARRPARRPARAPHRTPAALRRVREAGAGALRVAVAAGHRALTGPREWLQPGGARPVQAVTRARSSWLFHVVVGTLPSRAARVHHRRSSPWWRGPALFGYPGRRESKTALTEGRPVVRALPRPRPREHGHHGDGNAVTRSA